MTKADVQTKVNVSELQGKALDYAVAVCEGATEMHNDAIVWACIIHGKSRVLAKWSSIGFTPSTAWVDAGPIIEREGISIRRFLILDDGLKWGAYEEPSIRKPKPRTFYGSTPLIAAMRCYVASKHGSTIDIPSVLLTD